MEKFAYTVMTVIVFGLPPLMIVVVGIMALTLLMKV